MPRLVRRRLVWLPTVWGLLAVVVAAALTLALAGMASARWLGRHLAQSEPAAAGSGQGARTLVVEGWLSAGDLDAAVAAFRQGRYERVLVTGGPFDEWPEERHFPSYAERAADYLRRHGLADTVVTAVPAPASAQDRTFQSAVMVREWAARTGTRLDAIDLFSSGVHSRRSRLVFAMALGPGVEVGVLAAPPSGYELDRWWKTSAGAKAVLGEAISVAWTRCCFWPALPGSVRQRRAGPEPRQ